MSKAKDLSVKKCISLPSVFCDLYNGGAFKGKQLLKPKDLQKLPGESCEVYYDKNHQKREIQRYHDIIYGSAMGRRFVILPVENYKEVHYAMVIRNMLYDALIYADQVEKLQKEHRKIKNSKCNGQFLFGMLKEDRLKSVISLIFYYGEETWDGAMDLHNILPDRKVRP